MRHKDIRKQLVASVDHLLQEVDLPVTLRSYQRETLASVARWLSDPAGTRRGYIAHATGLGKTLLFSSLIRAAVGLRSLVIVPTRVLVEQTVQMLHPLTGGMIAHWSSVPNIENERGEIIATIGHQYADILVTTDESFVRYWGQMRKEFDPDLIIWDECHTAYAGKPQRALAAFEHAVIIGCSATPDHLSAVWKKGSVPVQRANRTPLFHLPELTASQHFQHQLDQRDLAWGIDNGWLSPLAWGSLDIAAELDYIPLTKTEAGWDFNQMALQKVMSRHWPSVIQAVLAAYRDNTYAVAGKRAYALCPGVVNALQLARDLTQAGIRAECITSDTNHKRRRLYLRGYNEGAIKFLSSVMVLREGWDAPESEVCWMLRPTYSYVLYVQGIGRVLRKSPTNPRKVATVIDPSFRGTTLSPLNVPALFAARDSTVVPGQTLLRAHQAVEPVGGACARF